MRIPPLETERLRIREFTLADFESVHHLLDVDLAALHGAGSREERRRWLEWTVAGYQQLAMLRQPPYGDRAIVLRSGGALIGACGLVPLLAPFGQISALGAGASHPAAGSYFPEVGLYWAIASAHQRRGYATEAAQALIAFGFKTLHLRRLLATTSYDNVASIRVMAKVGMRIERNPSTEPPWLQVVGILDPPTTPQ